MIFHYASCLDLCLFVPCFPDLLISLGKQELIILRLKSGPTLSPRRVIPYSPIKLLEFNFNQSGGAIQKEPLMKPGVLATLMDLFCFYRGRLQPERYSFCDL